MGVALAMFKVAVGMGVALVSSELWLFGYVSGGYVQSGGVAGVALVMFRAVV